jgi:nucleoporin POM152
MHGVPPFQVYYRTQQDKGEPRELVRNFYSSRGEITLQPEQSGHYAYTFVALSDANYKKVELNGPTIEQVVHPLASVDFTHSTSGGKKKKINSCSGSFVDVDVELKVRMVDFEICL